MVRIREYYRDEDAPRAGGVLPAAFGAVRDGAGRLLLVRRIDDGNWELPGGRIEVGESAVDTLVREVAEESGITLEVTGIAGVFSDPTHVLEDPGGVVHQQLALCFHAVPAPSSDGARPRPDGIETDAAAWFSTTDLARLRIHPAMRLRIEHALRDPGRPFVEGAPTPTGAGPPLPDVAPPGVPGPRQAARIGVPPAAARGGARGGG